jgi:hypothetical protein
MCLLAASAAFTGGAASAGSQRMATQCLDTNGEPHGAICRRGSVWDQSDICRCPGATQEVSAPYCERGETPAPDSLEANQARLAAARHGTLAGASYQGKRFCVRPSHTPG